MDYQGFFEDKINSLKKTGAYRDFRYIDRVCGKYPLCYINGNSKNQGIIWCSNDYLNMSQHPVVLDAMVSAVRSHGAGSGGSRNIGGSHSFFKDLEDSLAKWHGKESALVFPTGFSSNDATLQCLLRMFDNCHVFSDAKNHASIINGIRSTRATRYVFEHNDVNDLACKLEHAPLNSPKIIVIESIYSMDGDISPIREIVELAKRYKALTYLDEVHAVGIYGKDGSGISSEFEIESEVDIVQGTMAKSVGVVGGYIAGSLAIIDAVRSYCSGFIFTTALPPAVVAACHASVEHLKASHEERQDLLEKTKVLRGRLWESRIPVMSCSDTHIIPIPIGSDEKCKKAANYLISAWGIYIQPINSPTVEKGTERFRVNVTPNHTNCEINNLVDALRDTFCKFEISFLDRRVESGV